MTAFQRILINTERWNETVVTPSLAKPHELICTPNRIVDIFVGIDNVDTFVIVVVAVRVCCFSCAFIRIIDIIIVFSLLFSGC